ncbi:tripartite tricarboxylate transporter TctB family protein [Mycetocola miduiensis]|uniref:tripartite tricarboxylate transporter TctB family protein n=1 Tax=Mycetocola miduiensis TaxID=995034 RepID=UPI0015A701BF|nr:tripartite tricarboxylate transporter TctB family protein [Mycetocola miduiensis]
MTARPANLTVVAALALLGAGAVLGAIELGVLDSSGHIAAGFMPFVAGGAMLVLALIDLVHQARHVPGARAVDDLLFEQLIDGRPDTTDQLQVVSDIDIFGRDQRARNRQLAKIIVALVLCVALIPLLGLLASLGLLMAFAAIAVEHRSVVLSLVITAVTLAALYLIFAVLLSIPLPGGILGGLLS